MQKKKTTIKKNEVSTKEVTPEVSENKEKIYSKSLSFFAIFIVCIGAAALYPYLTQKNDSYYVPPKYEPQTETAHFQPVEPKYIQVSPTIEAPIEIPEVKDCSVQEQTILSQKKELESLNEKIHQLELDNLNLKEKASSSEKIVSSAAALVKEIYAGQPFKTTLGNLLRQDPANPLALAVQEKFGNYASTGIPSTEKLKELFNSQMKLAQKSFYICPKDASWNQKLTNFFKSLVHVYPQNITEETASPEDLLFLVRRQVNDEQFEHAIATIEKLPDSTKQVLKNFVQNVTRYIDARKTIESYLK